MALREEQPNLSLGTVYRNLSQLADAGEVQKIYCGDGAIHFDGDTHPHYHVICTQCGKVEDLLPAVLEKAPDAVVVLDPPRAGVARSVLKLLLEADVKKIVMISCDPATLARDLGILTGSLVETEKGELVNIQ